MTFLTLRLYFRLLGGDMHNALPSSFLPSGKRGGGGGEREAVAQSVERATPGEEVPGSIPAAATRSLLVGSVSV